jgi:hypothetical protein
MTVAAVYDADALLAGLMRDVAGWEMHSTERSRMRACCRAMLAVLDTCAGATLQERWADFEARLWPGWLSGESRPAGERWRWGPWALIMTRRVRPGWTVVGNGYVMPWVHHLRHDDPIRTETTRLGVAVDALDWLSPLLKPFSTALGARMLLAGGHERLSEITEQDLDRLPSATKGIDGLDAALCNLGVFDRTPRHGVSRRHRSGRRSAAEMVERSDIPVRFRAVTVLYLEHYAQRVSDTYATLHQKQIAIAHLWRFIDEHYPHVASSSQVTPAQVRAFVPHAIERARRVRRGPADRGDTTTAHTWLTNVRVFFADICTWATEPGSPFAEHAPSVVPLTRHDLVGVGFEKARRRGAARMAATVIDIERELPGIRAFALRRWHEAQQTLAAAPDGPLPATTERETFWDWAVLELLLQSGLRLEEALELTTLTSSSGGCPTGGSTTCCTSNRPSSTEPASSPLATGSAGCSPRSSATSKPSTAPTTCPPVTIGTNTSDAPTPAPPTCCRPPATPARRRPAPSVPDSPVSPPAPAPAAPTAPNSCYARTTAGGSSPPSTSTTTRRST